MIEFYIAHSENLYTFRMQNTTLSISITVAKTCEKVFRLNMTSAAKLKVENISFIVEK